MKTNSKRKIKSVSEFVRTIENIGEEWVSKVDNDFNPWFRGHRDATWKLLPQIYRSDYDKEYEEMYRRDFQLKAFPYLAAENSWIPRTDLEWYFLMQHYGMPTRLLDWTEGALIALLFAVSDYKSEKDAAVWMLNPWGLNQNLAGLGDNILTSEADEMKSYLPKIFSNSSPPIKPAAIQPPSHSKRISVQKGMFTIHGSASKALEEYVELDNHLTKIVIDGNYIKDIKRHLENQGITETSVYPDLQSLCKEIVYYYS
jgi:hypothetical protein